MWFSRFTQGLASTLGTANRTLPINENWHPREVAALMEQYYYSNGLYTTLALALKASGAKYTPLKSLRNPVYPLVEFYVNTVWSGPLPGALPVVGPDQIRNAVSRIFRDSNWDVNKQEAIRQLPMTGCMFLKVASNSSDKKDRKVYIQPIKTKNITDFKLDPHGNVIEIRIEVRIEEVKDGKKDVYTYTEYWNKQEGSGRFYKHNQEIGCALSQLGKPYETITLDSIGIDFLPFTYTPYNDSDDSGWGIPAAMPALDLIDEVNRKCTRFSQLMFRHNDTTHVLTTNAMDAMQRPLAPPRIRKGGENQEDKTGGAQIIEIGDSKFLSLPGMAKLELLVPNIKWDAHLKAIESDMDWIKDTLPELRWYDIMKNRSEISGRALLVMLGPAIEKAVGVRGIAESSLSKALKMAMTIGSYIGVKDFKSLGSYEDGDLELTFAERDVIKLSEFERVALLRDAVGSSVPIKLAAKKYGRWNDEELKELDLIMKEEATSEKKKTPSLSPLKRTPEQQQQDSVAKSKKIAPKMETVIDQTVEILRGRNDG